MPGGRPTIFTQELADKLCAQLANGDSMRTVCRSDDMPCKATVFMWLRTDEDFLDQYTRAKQESADALTDEMLDIADDASNDWMLINDKDNEGYRINGDHIQRSRLRIETRKWLASKLKPKKYGDKIDITGGLNNTSTPLDVEQYQQLRKKMLEDDDC